jgi:hypothetical protein
LSRNERGRFGTLKSDSTHHFFGNACTKSGSLRFSQFSGCWLILSVYTDLVQAFPKKWWVESDFKVPNLPLSLRLKVSGCHYNSIYNNTWKKQIKQLSKQLGNACTKSGSLRFSQFSGCWLILSVYIHMCFDFPFVRLFATYKIIMW